MISKRTTRAFQSELILKKSALSNEGWIRETPACGYVTSDRDMLISHLFWWWKKYCVLHPLNPHVFFCSCWLNDHVFVAKRGLKERPLSSGLAAQLHAARVVENQHLAFSRGWAGLSQRGAMKCRETLGNYGKLWENYDKSALITK